MRTIACVVACLASPAVGLTASSTSTPAPVATAVILPGFGNAVVDYVTPLGAPESTGLRDVLERRGLRVEIVPVERYDWIRVALGLFDANFWRARQSAVSGPAYGWYVERARRTVTNACDGDGDGDGDAPLPVLLIGHSAGGWLARAVLGDGPSSWDDDDDDDETRPRRWDVRALVTLGAPHAPPPEGVNCATRGALSTTNEAWPGSFLPDVRYVTVAGNAVTGTSKDDDDDDDDSERRDVDDVYKRRGERSARNVARINYQALLGRVDGVRGDGVIPVDIAHLDGAEQITLDGVLHSINEAGTTLPTDSWYGSEKIVDNWLTKTLELCGIQPR